ncbi:hypothetical protein HDU96_009476 [Phlyctochytrium bullatum]|nr:hypothetical protein HDU96_009476 [Phlyctochytrium bullatum]
MSTVSARHPTTHPFPSGYPDTPPDAPTSALPSALRFLQRSFRSSPNISGRAAGTPAKSADDDTVVEDGVGRDDATRTACAEGEEVSNEVLDVGNHSILLGLISQLTKGMDLHKVTLPTFVLEPRSMCERITDFMSHPELIMSTAMKEHPLERFIDVVVFFLSGWHIRPKGVKKPFNPILGELFRCTWTLPNNTSAIYLCEQVSHHPPISSYFYASPENHLFITGDLRPKSRFLGNSAATYMEGSTRITFANRPGEEYVITFPNMYARGILFGSMFVELGDTATVTCRRTGLRCLVEFKTKGAFWNTALHAVQGKIFHDTTVPMPPATTPTSPPPSSVTRPLPTTRRFSTPSTLPTSSQPSHPSHPSASERVVALISGRWTERIAVEHTEASPLGAGPPRTAFEVAKWPVRGKRVREVGEMEEFESRRLWAPVARGLVSKDLDAATAEKTAIEENQRELIRQREAAGVTWRPRFFVPDGTNFKFDTHGDLPTDPVEAFEVIREIVFAGPREEVHRRFWVEHRDGETS